MFKDKNQLDDFFGLKTEEDQAPHKESLRDFIYKKLSISTKLRLAPKVLSFRERYIILSLLIIITCAALAIPFTAYYHFTVAQPAYGGSFTEGILGEPRLINPLLLQTNDADRDLTSLIYSGLMKYNAQGKLVPDLAKQYAVSDDGLNYTIYLRDNAYWHDGVKVTADDVIFTIQAAQNTDYASLQQANWQGVEMEKVNDYTVIFKLKNKYAQFLNNLTIGILPQHLWQNIKPINFALSELNLHPVGSGPYVFDKLKKDKAGSITSYTLTANRRYYEGRPYIDQINILFFNSEDEMIDAYNRNQIENIEMISSGNLSKIKFRSRLNVQKIKWPRYFAAFFNQNQSTVLSDKNVRLALNYATDKTKLIRDILDNNGIVVDSPMISGVLDIPNDVQPYSYDPELAKHVLSEAGWNAAASSGNPDEKSILYKKGQKLEIRITTPTFPELTKVATILKDQWQAVGASVTIEVLPLSQLQQAIKTRQYEVLLFGEILNVDPDPFSLWHSSQKRDPGLNLALYDNNTADAILEQARQTLSAADRTSKYDDFQKIVVQDAPAVFLYSPLYLYGQARKIRGFETEIISMPSDRFKTVNQWYIKTKRIFR